jgi:hypothetical protein
MRQPPHGVLIPAPELRYPWILYFTGVCAHKFLNTSLKMKKDAGAKPGAAEAARKAALVRAKPGAAEAARKAALVRAAIKAFGRKNHALLIVCQQQASDEPTIIFTGELLHIARIARFAQESLVRKIQQMVT